MGVTASTVSDTPSMARSTDPANNTSLRISTAAYPMALGEPIHLRHPSALRCQQARRHPRQRLPIPKERPSPLESNVRHLQNFVSLRGSSVLQGDRVRQAHITLTITH